MQADSQQFELIATSKAAPVSVELQEEVAKRCQKRHDAIVQTYLYSQLTPCQLYGPLGWSQGTFSKLQSGAKGLPTEDYHKYQRACGNWILARYDAFHSGHELRPIISDAETRIRELEAKLADQDRAIQLLGDLLRGRK